MANTVCFTTGRKVHPVFTTRDDTTPFCLSYATLHSWNPLYLLDICTTPRCPAFSWIVKRNFFFEISFCVYIYKYIYIFGKLGCCAVDTALKSLYTSATLRIRNRGKNAGNGTRNGNKNKLKYSWVSREVYVTMQKKKGEGKGGLGLKRRYTEMEKLNRFRFFLPLFLNYTRNISSGI